MIQGQAERLRLHGHGQLSPRILPLEIGFLTDHGFPPAILQEAASEAILSGTTADRVLISTGTISEQVFYRALATELGLPFIQRPIVSDRAHYPGSIQTGIVALANANNGFVTAPQGSGLSFLFRHHPHERRLAVTTPTALRQAVMTLKRDEVRTHAALSLHRTQPDLSIKGNLVSFAQIAFALAALLFLPTIAFRHTTLLMALIGLTFFAMSVLRLTATINSPQPARGHKQIDNSKLPVYTIIVALYREEKVARQLIEALLKLDYPVSKLDIKIVLEADDRKTLSALSAITLPAYVDVIVAPPGQPRTKPRALNVALPLARGEYVVLYDAEDKPDPDQLRIAATSFACAPPDVVCLQAHLSIDNTQDNFLTRMFTIEYGALFDVINPGLSQLGCPLPLGGTSNHFRTSALRAMGGWDAWNVTEDADLGIRLARFGYKVQDLPSSTFEEAPGLLKEWMKQRTRWMKGFIQTSLCHSRHPLKTFRQLGFSNFIGAFLVSGGAVLSALGYPFFVMALVVKWISGSFGISDEPLQRLSDIASITLLICGISSILLPAWLAVSRRKLWSLLPWTLALPVYYVLVSIAAWRSLWELVRAPHYWNKTSHGLARTSRTERSQKHQAKPARTISAKTALP